MSDPSIEPPQSVLTSSQIQELLTNFEMMLKDNREKSAPMLKLAVERLGEDSLSIWFRLGDRLLSSINTLLSLPLEKLEGKNLKDVSDHTYHLRVFVINLTTETKQYCEEVKAKIKAIDDALAEADEQEKKLKISADA